MTSVFDILAAITPDMARELAVSQHVCVRPVIRRVLDRDTDTDIRVAIPCGSTRETVCPPCAHKARVLRMQQCQEGWHRTDEPETDPADGVDELELKDQVSAEDQARDQVKDEAPAVSTVSGCAAGRRVRSTRRESGAGELPRMAVEDRTVGKVFTAPDGRTYRPSMFLTLTLPSYGRIKSGSGVPVDPQSYDYRRAAMDALHFSKLVDRFWQNLRRCAGYKAQYFAAVEPQKRLAPHLHAALRGAIPRQVIRQVVAGTYVQVWWPQHDRPTFWHRRPVWDGSDYVDPDTGLVLPTWQEALDAVQTDSEARSAHVMRFGAQVDIRGIVAPSLEADRAVRYLTKYLTKSIAAAYTDPERADPDVKYHVDRLHAEIRILPCSPRCANWLLYGIQPQHAGPGLQPGRCQAPAHDRENLGCGGRRVLVSRQRSGKTLSSHRADRATVVREALLEAGIVAPEIERMAATVTSADGLPRFVWTDTKTDPATYTQVILASIAEQQRWRAQYEAAKQEAQQSAGQVVEECSATDGGPGP